MHVAASRGFPRSRRCWSEAGATDVANAAGKSVAAFEIEAIGLRRLTEEIRLLRLLPAQIRLSDSGKLSRLFRDAGSEGTRPDTEGSRNVISLRFGHLSTRARRSPALG